MRTRSLNHSVYEVQYHLVWGVKYRRKILKDYVSEVVQKIKIQTSKDLRFKFKFIDQAFTKSGIWSVGYYASTVGINEERIRKYIEHQGKQDLGSDFDLFS